MKALLDELKDEVAILNGWSSFNDMAGQYDCPKFVVDEVAKRYALQMCKETQRRCTENATTKHGYFSDGSTGAFRVVDKQSILSEDNIPKEVK